MAWKDIKSGAIRGLASWFVGIFLGAAVVIFGWDPKGWLAIRLATPPEWTDHPLLKIGIVILGMAIMVATFFYDRWQCSRAINATKRVPLTEFFALAAKAGWNVDGRAVSIGKNDPDLLLRALRQAAQDGVVRLHGRKPSTMPANLDTTPLVLIDASHFTQYEISPWGVGKSDNNENRTLRDEHPHSKEGGYRDLHVDQKTALAWLADAGKPEEPASFSISHCRGGAEVSGFESSISIKVTNTGNRNLPDCLVTIEQVRISPSGWRTLNVPLRTEDQINEGRNGRFALPKGETKIVPVLWERGHGEAWALIGEEGDQHPVTLPIEFLVGVYGGDTDGKVYLDIVQIEGRPWPKLGPRPLPFSFPTEDNEDEDVTW